MPPEFRVILVGTEYELNLGYAARVAKNFGFSELWLVSPNCRIGKDAVKYSKHAVDVLKSAKIVKKLSEATRGCSFIVGTSGVRTNSRHALRNPFTLEQFISRVKDKQGRVAVLFGREGTGLNQEEIKTCDFLVTIQANEEYSILNLSHAMAVILSQLFLLQKRRTKGLIRFSDPNQKKQLEKVWASLVDANSKQFRKPEKIKLAFRRVLGRALVSDLEAAAMLGLLQKLRKK